jgi:arginine N-succinyltransferase
MIIVRPVEITDIDHLMEIALAASPGMTTLPPDRESLERKILISSKSITSTIKEPGSEVYLLVMEDTDTEKLVGTASIIAKLGMDDQFYSYKLNKQTQYSRQINKKVTVETLHLTNHFEGFAEVATLYLTDAYRKNGNGKLLARSRYLFMAQFRERFPDNVMADLRGYFDENGRSPFWEALGRHFFDMSYSEADLYGALNGNQFIADLMPKHPIYVNLLPIEARDVIGRPNDQGKPALAMLEKEGFRNNGQVDIFDGAPSVDAHIDELKTIKDSHMANVSGTAAVMALQGEPEYLVCAGDIGSYRVCISSLMIETDGSVLLPQTALDALKIGIPDLIRYCAS